MEKKRKKKRTNVEEKVNLVDNKEDKEVEEPILLLSLNNGEKEDKCLWYLDNGHDMKNNIVATDSMEFHQNDEFILDFVSGVP